jgi:hypothetical protein
MAVIIFYFSVMFLLESRCYVLVAYCLLLSIIVYMAEIVSCVCVCVCV